MPLNPKAAAKPSCTPMGPIGVLADGAFLYNALDGEGRDAAAHEVLDLCGGHPDPSSSYHHHDVPSCLLAARRRTPPRSSATRSTATASTSSRTRPGTCPANARARRLPRHDERRPWNGRQTRIYHYVATLEYPYSVGCFHGTPIATGRGGPPGGAVSEPITDRAAIFAALRVGARAASRRRSRRAPAASKDKDDYELWSPKPVERNGRAYDETYFAGVIAQKAYVGFYYMPVYLEPDAEGGSSRRSCSRC